MNFEEYDLKMWEQEASNTDYEGEPRRIKQVTRSVLEQLIFDEHIGLTGRKEAEEQGKKYYLADSACIRNHQPIRNTKFNYCVQCKRTSKVRQNKNKMVLIDHLKDLEEVDWLDTYYAEGA